MSAVVWGLALMLGVVGGLAKKDPEGGSPIIAILTVLSLALSPLMLAAYGTHFVFDEHGIEAISFWRKRRHLPYRDLILVRRKLFGDGFVLRGSNGVTITINDSLGGWVTLSSQILKHFPREAGMSARARTALRAWAAAEPS